LCSARQSVVNPIVSAKGLQQAIDFLSFRLSALAAAPATVSVTSNEASAISAQAASAMSVIRLSVNALSLAVSLVQTSVNLADTHANTASAAATSADTHANTASAAATSADAHANAASAAATSVLNLHNTLSARVDTNSVAMSVLQAAVSNAFSAGDVISNTLSALSAGLGRPQLRVLTNGIATISAAALTKISGLSVSVALNGVYNIHAVLLHGHSAQGTNGFGFGISCPVATTAGGKWVGFTSVVAPSGASANFGYFNQAGFGSITYSATPAASATIYRTELDLLLCSVQAGTVQLKARTSAAGVGAIDIQLGSFIQAFKIG